MKLNERIATITSTMIVVLVFVAPSIAEWGRTANDYIRLPIQRDALICSDGNGGAWVTGHPAALCHVDSEGNLTWGGDEPYFVLPRLWNSDPKPVLADNGDVIIAMNVVYETGDPQNVQLQRISLDQKYDWGEEGIQLDTSSITQYALGAYAGPVDDTYLVHWVRVINNGDEVDMRIQLINGDGNLLWGEGGVGLNWPHANSHFITSSDQCIIIAQNVAPAPTIEVVKINPAGEVLWDSRFSTLWEDVRVISMEDSESDRTGGVILVYEYYRRITIDDTLRRYYGINAMRVSDEGDSLWTRQLYEREKEPGEQYGSIDPIINYAGSGRYFMAWSDYPHAFQVSAIDVDGELFWDEPVDIITFDIGLAYLDAVDSDHSVCYVWREAVPDREDGRIVQQWGQRINLNEECLWGDRGRAIQARSIWKSSITTDGNGGVISVVEHGPSVQMINRNGEIGVVLEVGIDENIDRSDPTKLSPQLQIYPNPSNSFFKIEFDNRLPNEVFSYDIYNLMGRSVLRGMMMGSPYLVNDLSPFASGEYILMLESTKSRISKRITLIK